MTTPKTYGAWKAKKKIYNLSYSDDATLEDCWNTSGKATRQEMQAEIDKRDTDIRWLCACLKNFHPFKEQPDSGMCPTFYQTLSYDGDLELYRRFRELTQEKDERSE